VIKTSSTSLLESRQFNNRNGMGQNP